MVSKIYINEMLSSVCYLFIFMCPWHSGHSKLTSFPFFPEAAIASAASPTSHLGISSSWPHLVHFILTGISSSLWQKSSSHPAPSQRSFSPSALSVELVVFSDVGISFNSSEQFILFSPFKRIVIKGGHHCCTAGASDGIPVK